MAPKNKPIADDIVSPTNAGDQELEQAIDDLRGVLQQGAAGDVAEDPLAAFGGDFGADIGSFDATLTETETTTTFGGSDFGFGDDSSADTSFAEAARPGSAMDANLDLIMDIPIDLQIVLGSSQMQVSSLMSLTEGATIALDRRIGEPVEIMVNGRVIGRGEITVLEHDDTRFGVKLIEVKSTRKI